MEPSPQKVEVTLVDHATGETVGTTEMFATALPESFGMNSVVALRIGGENWSVVDAEPRTRVEYAKSGKLLLRLRRHT